MPARFESLPLLDAQELERGVRILSRRDRDLRNIVRRLGTPPLWSRAPGFATLLRIILEQQVSLASARSVFEKLKRGLRPLNPAGFLGLSDRELRAMGFSRQKSRYCRELALAIENGDLRLGRLKSLSDEAVRAVLTAVKGIGPWTANIYLMMALGRPDVWPGGDLALARAMQDVKGLRSVPDQERQLRVAENWRPYRAVAARLLWQHYLNPILPSSF